MDPSSTLADTRTLAVYAGADAAEDLVGTLAYAAGGMPLRFDYADSWLARDDFFPLSPLLAPDRLNTLDADQHGVLVTDFLCGLLPSGQPLAGLAADLRRRADDLVGLLSSGGGLDTFGALRFGRPPPAARSDPFQVDVLREVPLNELSRRIAWRDTLSLLVWDDKVHALLPGSRDKVALHIIAERRSLVVADRVASTHLLKIGGTERTCASLSSNELFVMRLAAACGLPVATISLQQLDCGPVLLTQRFDRQRRPRGNSIHRLHAITGWQLLGLAPQAPGAPAQTRHAWLSGLLRAVHAHAADPQAETLELLRRVIWQVLTGSCNMDPGNLAFFVEAGGRLRLAPAFALRTLWPFERNDGFVPRELALPVGGEVDPQRVDAAAWGALAEESGVPIDELLGLVQRLGRQLVSRIPTALRQCSADGASPMVTERLAEGVRELALTVVAAAGAAD